MREQPQAVPAIVFAVAGVVLAMSSLPVLGLACTLVAVWVGWPDSE